MVPQQQRGGEAAMKWQGDLDDDCKALDPPYLALAEDMGQGWWCAVHFGERRIFDSTDDDIAPLTGEAARRLCEYAIAYHRWVGTADTGEGE